MSIKKIMAHPVYAYSRDTLSVYVVSIASIVGVLAILAHTVTPTPVQASIPSLNLHKYSIVQQPFVLKDVHDNASGLTYNHETNTLFAAINNPEAIIEIDTQGNTLRHISLEGFEDTEAITYLGNGKYAIAEERRRCIIIVNITSSTSTLLRSQQRSIALPRIGAKNNGFEGIAFDPNSGSIYVSSEKAPRELYHLEGFIKNTSHLSISHLWDLEEEPLGNDDVSGLYFDSQFGHILMLSDESQQLVEANLQGKKISYLDLSGDSAGLSSPIPQAEGITLGADNTLYILSEPNLLYKFTKR